MRAAVFSEFVGPEGVTIEERPDPEPGPGEAVVDVAGAALNHHDLWILEGSGAIGSGGPPFVSGVDLAGEVSATGPDVDSVAVGDRVVLCPNLTCGRCHYCREGPENRCQEYALYHGGFAERAVVDADRLIELPASVDLVEAAALPVAYMTAWHMLRRADAGAGDVVFVPGATGGVGVAAVQLASVIGASSIGSSRSPAKLERLEAETDIKHTVATDDPDELRERVQDIGPADVTLNHLSGPYTDVGLSVLARGGTMVVCGATAGQQSEVDVRSMYLAHQRLIGSTMGTQADLATVVGFVDRGQLSPIIGAEYPLEETGQAFADMQERDLFGKLVVRPWVGPRFAKTLTR